MIRSMTGYGEADAGTPAGRLRVELRTVNHRYFHASTRLPHALARWDAEIREWLRVLFPRGAVSCTIRLEPGDAAAAVGLRLDNERIAAYLALFEELGERFGVPGTPSLELLARYNDIFVRGEDDEGAATLGADELRPVIEAAARQAIRMREDEGLRLSADLEARLAAVEQVLDRIGEWAPARIVAERDRLRAAVQELAEGVAIDDARLAQEIAVLAERWDVNEELVRFHSHLDLFRELLGSEAKEPVGKRLSFLVQEMHREANTIGSKANDARIAHAVVALKDEIERLREQVENVE